MRFEELESGMGEMGMVHIDLRSRVCLSRIFKEAQNSSEMKIRRVNSIVQEEWFQEKAFGAESGFRL